MKCHWSSRASTRHTRQFKKTSWPRGRRHTAKTLLLCSLSCCHSLIKHTHTHTRITPQTKTPLLPVSIPVFAGWRLSPLHSLMQGEIRPNTWKTASFWQVSVRTGPGADGAASYAVNPQHKSREQATQWSTGAAPGVGGEHITNLFSGRQGASGLTGILPVETEAGGEGDMVL